MTNPSQPEKSPNAVQEEQLLQFWRDNNVFEKTLSKEDAPAGEYRFFDGPPTANGMPGIHHVMPQSFKDLIPRYKTMRGFRVNRKAGWDTHGLPVELQVEKELGLKSKKEIEAYGVAAFNQKCKESVWKYKEEWMKMRKRMAYWTDMDHPYITYSNEYIEALWSVVKKCDERGHLYQDFKVLPWCPRCGTPLSSHELNQPGAYKDVKDLSVYVKFPIVGFEKAYFLAWTTTPWTLPGNVGLAVGADIDYVEAKVEDEIYVLAKELTKILPEGYEIIAEHKGSEMVGMQYEPLFPFLKELLPGDQQERLRNAYKVYAADFVTTTDGTGIVHTAVMYGVDDFELGTKFDLPKFHTVNEEGKFIPGTGFLEGRYVKEVDENGKPTLAVDIVNDLTARGLLFKKENYLHSYPHCWRCDTPLLYYARTSWYFGMSKLRGQLVVANQEINWEPDHVKEGRFGEWLDGIKDWAISRDRYWGTPLPVWSTESGKRVVIGGLEDLKKYTKKSGNSYFMMRHGESEKNTRDLCSSNPDAPLPLTEKGRSDAKQTALGLVDSRITKIIASPFVRTRETAEIVADILGISRDQIVYDPSIGELHYGDFDGKSKSEYHAWHKESNAGFSTKIPGGESIKEARNRVGQALYRIDKQYSNENILIVTHGIFLESMPSLVGGWNEEETMRRWKEDIQSPGTCKMYDFVPLPHNENYALDFHKPYIDEVELELDGESLKRTPEVMDVWFDSGCMPIAQSHELGGDVNFDPAPADYIAEGMDQTRGWFYTMHAISNMLHDKPSVAYKNAICMGLLMDANGQKMSKSKGNVVDPWTMFDKYGADVVRFWFYSVNQPGETKNFDEKGLDEVNKKVFNLLRNVVSFYEMYKDQKNDFKPHESKNVLDEWIIALWNKTLRVITEGLESYQPLEPARAIREFVGELSTWYIRRSRDRFKSEGDLDKWYALATTEFILKELSKAMAPFTPFLAEEIWLRLGEENSVHLEQWPSIAESKQEELEYMAWAREFIRLGLEQRSKHNIKVRQPLAQCFFGPHKGKDIVLNDPVFNPYQALIMDELNVKKIVLDESLPEGTAVLDATVTQELRDEGDMRELVRKMQDMRKEAGFEPKDRVVVSLSGDEPAWFEKFKSEICQTVGAEKVAWGSEDGMKKVL